MPPRQIHLAITLPTLLVLETKDNLKLKLTKDITRTCLVDFVWDG